MAGSLADLGQIRPFDANAFIQAGQAGQRQRTLADLGQYAAKGDYQNAAAAAFSGGQTDIGAQLSQMSTQQHQQLVNDAASLAQAADTPEKWDAAGKQFTATHPGVTWAPFQARNVVINQALTAQDQINNRFKQEELANSAAAKTAAANKPPNGYRWNQQGTALEAIPGGPGDPFAFIDPSGGAGAGAAQAAAPTAAAGAPATPPPTLQQAAQIAAGRMDGTASPPAQAAPTAAPGPDDAGAATTDPGAPLTGEAYLKTLPPAIANVVRSVGTYQADLSKIAPLRSNARAQFLSVINQAYPGFDMTAYPVRAATRKAFTTGPQGQALVSNRTAIHHLGQLWDDVDNLNNGNFVPLNAFRNSARTWAGDNAVTNVNTDMQAVATEVGKALRGAGAMSEGEIDDWKQNFSTNASKSQMQGAIQRALHLLGARNQIMGQSYYNSMGTQLPIFLNGGDVQALNKMGVDPGDFDPNGTVPGFTPNPPGGGAGSGASGGQGASSGGWTVEAVN